MRKFVVAMLAFILFACNGPQKQEGFQILGTIKGLTQKMAFLERIVRMVIGRKLIPARLTLLKASSK